jgi:hypothetical protein
VNRPPLPAIVVLAILFAAVATNTRSDDSGDSLTGDWVTDHGRMTIAEPGEQPCGSYTAGQVIGELTNCEWSDDHRQVQGDYGPNGDTGIFTFVLDPQGRSFNGWYRIDQPGVWNGIRTSRSDTLQGTWTTDLGRLFIDLDNRVVCGSYVDLGGGGKLHDCTVTDEGRTLIGTWTGVGGTGTFRFALEEDTLRFSGSYRNPIEFMWNGVQPELAEMIEGTWETDFGTLTIALTGELNCGRFTYDNVSGVLRSCHLEDQGRILSGRWIETDALGSFRFTFSEDGSGFSGEYTFTGHWNGQRITE